MILEGAQAALALAPIAFAGGFIQGLTGFGSALVTIPLATFFVPLPYALAVFAIVDFVNGLRLGLENPRNAVLGDIARMVPFMIVGIVAGTTLLVNLPRNASLIALGIFVLGYAIYSLSRRGLPPPSAGTGRSSPDSPAAFRERCSGPEGRLTRSISPTALSPRNSSARP